MTKKIMTRSIAKTKKTELKVILNTINEDSKDYKIEEEPIYIRPIREEIDHYKKLIVEKFENNIKKIKISKEYTLAEKHQYLRGILWSLIYHHKLLNGCSYYNGIIQSNINGKLLVKTLPEAKFSILDKDTIKYNEGTWNANVESKGKLTCSNGEIFSSQWENEKIIVELLGKDVACQCNESDLSNI